MICFLVALSLFQTTRSHGRLGHLDTSLQTFICKTLAKPPVPLNKKVSFLKHQVERPCSCMLRTLAPGSIPNKKTIKNLSNRSNSSYRMLSSSTVQPPVFPNSHARLLRFRSLPSQVHWDVRGQVGYENVPTFGTHPSKQTENQPVCVTNLSLLVFFFGSIVAISWVGFKSKWKHEPIVSVSKCSLCEYLGRVSFS